MAFQFLWSQHHPTVCLIILEQKREKERCSPVRCLLYFTKDLFGLISSILLVIDTETALGDSSSVHSSSAQAFNGPFPNRSCLGVQQAGNVSANPGCWKKSVCTQSEALASHLFNPVRTTVPFPPPAA
ncbi:hypothetical protein EK904_004602 [Melospiza melodia maxima]|nr:hypothetical protein EK904_004602 [Melospiza melodia maxima]